MRAGDRTAEDALYGLVEPELRRIARGLMRKEWRNDSLQPTALINEAYLRMAGLRQHTFHGRVHFYAVAARVMRRILVDRARAAQAAKRGDGFQPVSFHETFMGAIKTPTEMIALDDALHRLAEMDARLARVVDLRFFGGLTEEETADFLGISTRTVKRDWKLARAWLFNEMSK